MEEQNDLLLEQDEKQYPEKWLKIGVNVGIFGALFGILPQVANFTPDAKELDEVLSPILDVVSFIGDAAFTIVEAIFLYLITCKMKSNNMQKPSVLLFYILIASSCLAFFEGPFDDVVIIGFIYLAMLLITGFSCLSISEMKKLGISMLLLPVGAIISMIILEANNHIHSKGEFILTILPYMAAVIFYLESCSKFLKSSKPKEVPAQD